MDVIVRDSPVQGRGVFAVRNFKQGEMVLDWSDSKVLTKEELENLPQELKKFVYHGEQKVLVSEPARYVNHSCDSNTFIRGTCGITKRDVFAGEEITEDYSLEGNLGWSMTCTCGSRNCKGVITAENY